MQIALLAAKWFSEDNESQLSNKLNHYLLISGFDLNGSTIPHDILVTSATLSLWTDIKRKYTCLSLHVVLSPILRVPKTWKTDLSAQGYDCYIISFEVWSIGYVSKLNKTTWWISFKLSNWNQVCLSAEKGMSKTTLLCSFSIFHAYTQPTWWDPPLLILFIFIMRWSKLCCGLHWYSIC